MATRSDFSEQEWATLQKGITGSGLLVSLSDRDFTDTFGEASAIGKYLAGQQMTAPSELLRELAKARGTGFGLTVEVMLDNVEANARKSNGSFGWGGAFGTYYWVDRKEQLAAVMMIQTPYSPLRRDFENAVMQAIVD